MTYHVTAGLCAYGGQVSLTSALRLVEVSPATAMSYLTVVWGLILGYFVFREVRTTCLLWWSGMLPKSFALSSVSLNAVQKHVILDLVAEWVCTYSCLVLLASCNETAHAVMTVLYEHKQHCLWS